MMLLETLQVLADQLYTVLMTLVEGASLDILVSSGSGEGLEAWQRLHKRWDSLTTGRARGLLKEILSLDVPSRESCKEQWNDSRTRCSSLCRTCACDTRFWKCHQFQGCDYRQV